MALSFSCPSCSVTLRVADDQVGLSGRCSSCGEPVQVPTVRAPESHELAEAAADLSATGAHAAQTYEVVEEAEDLRETGALFNTVVGLEPLQDLDAAELARERDAVTQLRLSLEAERADLEVALPRQRHTLVAFAALVALVPTVGAAVYAVHVPAQQRTAAAPEPTPELRLAPRQDSALAQSPHQARKARLAWLQERQDARLRNAERAASERAARVAEEDRQRAAAKAHTARALEEATRLVAQSDPANVARGLDALAQLAQRADAEPELKEHVKALRAAALLRVAHETAAAAEQALACEAYEGVLDTVESVKPLFETLPTNLQTLSDRAQARLDRAQRESADAQAAVVAKQRAAYEAAVEARELERKSLAQRARAATEAWLAARAPCELLCSTCEGHVVRACLDCKTRPRSYLSGKQACRTCSDTRKRRCPRCTKTSRGYSMNGVRKAFWRFLSPAARRGTSPKAVARGVLRGSALRELLGKDSLLVGSYEVESVEVMGDRVRVEAKVGFAKITSRYLSRRTRSFEWIRAGEGLYLKTHADTELEPMLPPLPQLPVAVVGARAFSTTQGVAELAQRLSELHARRDQGSRAAWNREVDALREQLKRTAVADRAIVDRVVVYSDSARATLELGPHSVIVRTGPAGVARFAELREGESVGVHGRLSRWGARDFRRTQWRFELEDATLE